MSPETRTGYVAVNVRVMIFVAGMTTNALKEVPDNTILEGSGTIATIRITDMNLSRNTRRDTHRGICSISRRGNTAALTSISEECSEIEIAGRAVLDKLTPDRGIVG